MTAQKMKALREANKIRLSFAALRQELRGLDFAEARKRCAEILVGEGDPNHEHIKLDYLLLSCRWIGPRNLRNMVWDAGLAPQRSNLRLRQLNNRERCDLARVLRRGAQKK
jgi:hypothetical protein